MADVGKFFNQYFLKAMNKEIGWATDNVKCMFCTSAYVPNKDTHVYKSQVTNEISGAQGYNVGGVLLTNKTMRYDSTSGKCILDADDIALSDVTINNVRVLVIYVDKGDASTSPLIGFITLAADHGVTNGAFSVQWNDAGIFTHTPLS